MLGHAINGSPVAIRGKGYVACKLSKNHILGCILLVSHDFSFSYYTPFV